MHSTDTAKPSREQIRQKLGKYGEYYGSKPGLKNRVRVRLTHNGKQLTYPIRKADDPKAEKQAEKISKEIEAALVAGTFDQYWAKFKGETQDKHVSGRGKGHLQAVDQDYRKCPITTLELWDKYVAYRKPHVSPNTVSGTYIKVVRNNLSKAGIDDLAESHRMKA